MPPLGLGRAWYRGAREVEFAVVGMVNAENLVCVLVIDMVLGCMLCWSWLGGCKVIGQLSASVAKMPASVLSVSVVVFSIRHVRSGLVRPCWRFRIAARQIGFVLTSVVMLDCFRMKSGSMGMSRRILTFVLR